MKLHITLFTIHVSTVHGHSLFVCMFVYFVCIHVRVH